MIRWLSKEDYATFTLALAIQGTAAVLVELGFSSGLVALVGTRFKEPVTVGRYVSAVMFYRTKLLVVGALVLAAVFFLSGNHYGWDTSLIVVIWTAVVGSLIFEARSACYTPILELHQHVKEIYLIDLISSAGRFALIILAYVSGLLSAPVALLIGMFQVGLGSSLAKHWAKNLIKIPTSGTDITGEKKELLSLTLPKVVGAVFFAFQGQVTIFLIGIFGQYNQMADLGALSRIGMLFLMPTALVIVLLVPWFTKLTHQKIVKAYAGLIGIYSIFGLCLILATKFFPNLFLFILGSGYASLEYEIYLFAISSTFGLLSGLCYHLTACRKWVFYWSGPAAVTAYIGLIICFVCFVDLSKISNVIILSIFNTAIMVLIYQIVFFVGYRRDSAKLASSN